MKELTQISLAELEHHPKNPRKTLGDLEELAESIKAKGIMQNLTVIPNPEKGGAKYLVVIGNRRLEAAKIAGLDTAPCMVVDMTEQEAISTMLVENIQRSDLTVFEQAQGFQLMLDVGETIDSISEKTGFSETTIRRRVKLMELDQKKLESACERQISLTDIAKLNEIKSVETRNKLLDVIGTSNFAYRVQNELSEEARKEAEALWRDLGKKEKLKELKSSDAYSGHYEKIGIAETAEEFAELIKEDGAGFFLIGYDRKCTVWRKIEKVEDEDEPDPEEERREKCREKLKTALESAFELRRDFVAKISNTAAKKKLPFILKTIFQRQTDRYTTPTSTMIAAVMGLTEYDVKDKDEKLVPLAVKSPEKALLAFAYSAFGDNKDKGGSDWWGHYRNDPIFKAIYDFLIELGYNMSDDEKALLDGTSELFIPADKPEDDEEENENEDYEDEDSDGESESDTESESEPSGEVTPSETDGGSPEHIEAFKVRVLRLGYDEYDFKDYEKLYSLVAKRETDPLIAYLSELAKGKCFFCERSAQYANGDCEQDRESHDECFSLDEEYIAEDAEELIGDYETVAKLAEGNAES